MLTQQWLRDTEPHFEFLKNTNILMFVSCADFAKSAFFIDLFYTVAVYSWILNYILKSIE